MFACLHAPACEQEMLLALASSFSPLVENTAPGMVVLSIAGLGKLIGTTQQIAAAIARSGVDAGMQANLAISADPDTAVLAARHLRGITLIPPGREADRLGGLPVHVLGSFESAGVNTGENAASPELLATLESWGVHTLAEFAALPELGLIARFGEEGRRCLQLARGETRRSLRALAPPENYQRRVDLDHPQRLLEPLLFVIASLLNELMEMLAGQGLAANRVTLGLALAGKSEHRRTLEFPVPVRDPQVLLKQLQFDLEAHPPQAAIVGVEVRLHPVEPRVLQHGLFVPQAPAPEKLHRTLARLTALLGEGNVGSPHLLDTHRPDAFVMRPFAPEAAGNSKAPETMPPPRFAFRYYRPAIAAQVRVRMEQPISVNSKAVSGNITIATGPWLASGDWWTDAPWNRAEWDIELSNGGLYRVYQSILEPGQPHWYLEGMYD
jgi:protein ImuB